VIFSDTLVHRTYGVATANALGGDDLPAPTAGSIRASVQRPSNAEVMRFRDQYVGKRTDDLWFVDTNSKLKTVDEPGGRPADQVDIVDASGVARAYEVVAVQYVRGVIVHYEALVARIVEGKQP
tara:strand:- start:1412 stop:1783 length:372 start_codon:yes stop_codon:yes gene_type:complete